MVLNLALPMRRRPDTTGRRFVHSTTVSSPGFSSTPTIPKQRINLFFPSDLTVSWKASFDATPCEPRDIIANRLDPWHGAHFHPYAFTRLEVTDHNDDELHLRVAYKVTRGYEIEVGARFDCPDPRTIVMTITDGEGTGSVVETHATPVRSAQTTGAPIQLAGREKHHRKDAGGPLTTVIEATLATSDRPGFAHAQRGAVIARPIIKAMAARLWRDDARYAERLYQLRTRNPQ